MAGGVTTPAVCCSLPLLLLLLLPLLSASRAAAADARCFRLANVTTVNGHRRTDVRVNREKCACEKVSLFVSLNSSGMPVDCGQTNGSSWHDTNKVANVIGGLATFHTVVAGCFQARCTCADSGHCHQHWDFDGLDYSNYNLYINTEQQPGLPLRFDVNIDTWPDKNASHYFPSLKVRLYYRCPHEESAKTADPECNLRPVLWLVVNAAAAAGDLHFELPGSGKRLTSGQYRLVVLPNDSWVCQGSNNGCKLVQHNVSVDPVAPSGPAALPADVDDRMKALYAVIGVTLAVIAAGLVFLWRECSAVRPGQGAPFAAKAPAPNGAQVLLVHLWTGQRLAQLKMELRDVGLQVTDFQERKVASLLRAMPVADVLVTDRLRQAKLVFLCSERALQLERSPTVTGSGGGPCENGGGGGGGGFSTAAAGGPLGHEALFSAVLHCVRNSALAQDYQRVFVVLPEGGGDAGPAALVPGCRFRWPVDAPELIRQLSLAPAETDLERVV